MIQVEKTTTERKKKRGETRGRARGAENQNEPKRD